MRRHADDAAGTGRGGGHGFVGSGSRGGFDTFGTVAKAPGGTERFLATIREREQQLMHLLFDSDPVACEPALRAILGQAR